MIESHGITDAEGFNMYRLINEIYKHIAESIEKQTKRQTKNQTKVSTKKSLIDDL